MRSLPVVIGELSACLKRANALNAEISQTLGLNNLGVFAADPVVKKPAAKGAKVSVRGAVLKVMPVEKTLLTREIVEMVRTVRPGTDASQVSAILGDMVTKGELARAGKADGDNHPHKGMMLWSRPAPK